MKKSNPTDRSHQDANAQLDALLHKGVLADKRATKTPFPDVAAQPAPAPGPVDGTQPGPGLGTPTPGTFPGAPVPAPFVPNDTPAYPPLPQLQAPPPR